MKKILAITRKELDIYFGSLLSLIFLGVFLAATLFVFFTVEKFFVRGLADARPMFTWMPVLLIGLLAALTMRQWSEEQRSGTLESLLTLPVKPAELVLGKFLAVMAIIVLALALTLPIPVMVSLLGNLDWGPVFGGYLAAVLMAAAYAAIGLFVSSRTDNQIVSLIVTVLIGGVFYLVGTRGITDLTSGITSDVLWALGTGSRFESIERGVIDLRDLVYYLSLTAIFLTLNVLSLDARRWSAQQKGYQNRMKSTVALLCANLLVVNAWLYPLSGLRLDLTAQKEFTISQVTRDLVGGLPEPLSIRAYISENTHPLLKPLIPQLRDMLRELEIASGGSVTTEVVDPLNDPEIENEAAQEYGISATPFQISGRNEASIVNAYFDVLVRYGDQWEALNFSDLIDINNRGEQVEVSFRSLEYDLARAIKKVVYGFQSVDAILTALEQPVTLTYYVSGQTLPAELVEVDALVRKVGEEIAAQSNGKLVFRAVDPDQPGAAMTRQQLQELGVQPFQVTLFSDATYFYHLILENNGSQVAAYPPVEPNEAEVRTTLEGMLKRSSDGFLKVVGVWSPSEQPTQDMFGQMQQPISTFQAIREQLRAEYTVKDVDLSAGSVPADIDTLLLIAPQNFGEMELFAVDQFLMRGGALVVASGSNTLGVDPYYGEPMLTPIEGGLRDLLAHYGVKVGSELVLDPQNAAFPVAVNRDVNGYTVQDIQAVDYPFFIDVRSSAMSQGNPVTTNLPAVSFNYASVVDLDEEKNAGRSAEVLLSSSAQSWTTADITVVPDFQTYPEWGFPTGQTRQPYPLGVAVQGQFESAFKGKQPPQPQVEGQAAPAVVLEQSPANARLVVFGSADFLNDFALQLSARLSGDYYLNNLRLMQNAVDWSVEDEDLLSIRARGSAIHLLAPLSDGSQRVFEGIAYGLESLAMVVVFFFWQARKRGQKALELLPVEQLSIPGRVE